MTKFTRNSRTIKPIYTLISPDKTRSFGVYTDRRAAFRATFEGTAHAGWTLKRVGNGTSENAMRMAAELNRIGLA
jgi:hypothetical protein